MKCEFNPSLLTKQKHQHGQPLQELYGFNDSPVSR